MNVPTAIRAGVRAPLRRPSEVLPFYLLVLGAIAIARVPALLAFGLALLLLIARNRVEPLVRELEGVDWAAVEQSPHPGLQQAIANLVTPGTVALILVGVIGFVCAAVVTRSIASAGVHSALFSAIRSERPAASEEEPTPIAAEEESPSIAAEEEPPSIAAEGAAGIGSHWQSFLVIGIVRSLLVGGAVLAGVIGLGLTVTIYGAIVGVPLLVLAAAGGIGVTLALAFAGTAVVVDDVGAAGAIRRSVEFPFRDPAAFLAYAVLLSATAIGLPVLGMGLDVLGISRVASLVSLLVVFPLLDGIKVALYAGEDVRSPEPLDIDRIPGRVRAELLRGVRSLGAFVRDHPIANAAGLATMLLGVGLGWAITAPYGTRLDPPPDIASTFGQVPVGPFLNIAANNWLVAAGGSYGGIALGVPSAASLLFNGVLVGAVAGVFDLTAFLALVGPHGVLEVPALGVSGGLGYHLGRVGWGALRGRHSAAVVGEELRRAFYVLVGLAPIFLLAAFIEAFVTPHVAAAVVG